MKSQILAIIFLDLTTVLTARDVNKSEHHHQDQATGQTDHQHAHTHSESHIHFCPTGCDDMQDNEATHCNTCETISGLPVACCHHNAA